MSISVSTAVKNAIGNALVEIIDSGSTYSTGYIEIRSGVKPLTPSDDPTGVLLALLLLSTPPFSDFSDGRSLSFDILDDTSVDATGTAGWFRVYNKDGVGVMDGTVTQIGGGGDITFENINFIEGGVVSIRSIAISVF